MGEKGWCYMEYISREDAREMAARIALASIDGNITCGDVKRLVDAIPSADVAEVRHGKWIWDENGMDWNIGAWRCSICHIMSPMWWNADKRNPQNCSGHRFCPNCGAKMDS